MHLLGLVAISAGGFVLSEASVYAWHRWACHRGVFRRLYGDFLRQRHYDHHHHKYPPGALQSATYATSCDAAFRVMGFVLVALLLVATLARIVTPAAALATFCGIALHAWIGARLHVLYHLDRPAGPLLRWMRRFHDGHHTAPSNYGLVWPLFDILGGTYLAPRAVSDADAAILFDDFDPAGSRTCGEPLIGRDP